jgi:ketosteroid isomerase-like protein
MVREEVMLDLSFQGKVFRMKRTLAIVFIIVAASILSQGQTKKTKSEKQLDQNKQALTQTVRAWMDALVSRDMAALNRIIADDYLITVSDGRVLNKTQDLEPITSDGVRFLSAVPEDLNVRIFGETAVVTGRGIYQITFKNRSATIYERFTDVYVKRHGRWQPVASHSTTMKQPQPAATPPQP